MATITPAHFINIIRTVVVTIAQNGTTSSAGDLSGSQLVAVQLPATFEGTALTFTGSTDGSTYVAIYVVDGASAYSITVGTSRIVPVDVRVFAGLTYVKAVSNAGGGENAATTVTLITRPV